jgi:hypothetical protein
LDTPTASNSASVSSSEEPGDEERDDQSEDENTDTPAGVLNRQLLPEELQVQKPLINSAKKWFQFLKRSSSVEQGIQRLQLFAEEYPTQRRYVEGNLAKTEKFWCDAFFVWTTGWGIDVSSIQEGLHHI